MKRLSDTSPEAERVRTEVFRRITPGQKWLQLGQNYRDARMLHAAGVRLRQPGATPRQIHEDWMRLHLGFTLADRIGEPAMDVQCLRDLRSVIAVFTKLGIAYAVGGSVASSVHGMDRYTKDADITVDPFPGKENDLVAGFGPDWYVSLSAVPERGHAHGRRGRCNGWRLRWCGFSSPRSITHHVLVQSEIVGRPSSLHRHPWRGPGTLLAQGSVKNFGCPGSG
jgi:hypothetical protein